MAQQQITIGAATISLVTQISWAAKNFLVDAALRAGTSPVRINTITIGDFSLGSNRITIDVTGGEFSSAWEQAAVALILEVAGSRIELPGPDHTSIDNRDADDPYQWTVPSTIDVAAWQRAYNAASGTQKVATRLTLQDTPPVVEGSASITAGVPTISATGRVVHAGSASITAGAPNIRVRRRKAVVPAATHQSSASINAAAPVIEASGTPITLHIGAASINAGVPTIEAVATRITIHRGAATINAGTPAIGATGDAVDPTVHDESAAISAGVPTINAVGGDIADPTVHDGAAAINAGIPTIGATGFVGNLPTVDDSEFHYGISEHSGQQAWLQVPDDLLYFGDHIAVQGSRLEVPPITQITLPIQDAAKIRAHLLNDLGLGEWADPITVEAADIDTPNREYIYRATATNTKPARPTTTTQQRTQNDVVPTDWSDDPISPTEAMPYVWFSTRIRQAGTWTEFSGVELWNAFSRDTPGREFIFRATSNSTAPARPTTSSAQRQTADHVPTGWLDDDPAPTPSLPYVWASTRTRQEGGVWNEFSAVRVWRQIGNDTPNREYIYRATATNTKPARPTTTTQQRTQDEVVPNNWSDDASSPSATNRYVWFCTRIRVEGTWTEFSAVELWNSFGIDTPGLEFIYQATDTDTKPDQPTTTDAEKKRSEVHPTGWADNAISPTEELPFVWFCTRKRSDGTWTEFSAVELWDALGESPPLPGAPVVPIVRATSSGLNTDSFYAFIVGIARGATEKSNRQLGKSRIQISNDPAGASNHNATSGFTQSSMIVLDQNLDPPDTLWTALIADYGIYHFSAQVQNKIDDSWSPWSAPVSEATTRESQDTGHAGRPTLIIRNTDDVSDVRNFTILRPETNFDSGFGYDVQVVKRAFPVRDTNSAHFTTGLKNIRASGSGQITIGSNVFEVSGGSFIPGDLVGKILYIHNGINSDGTVTFPHANVIRSNTATQITVTSSVRFRVNPILSSSPPSTQDRTFEFFVADDWLAAGDSGLVAVHNINLIGQNENNSDPVHLRHSFLLDVPDDSVGRTRLNGLYGTGFWSHLVTVRDDPISAIFNLSAVSVSGVITISWDAIADAEYELRGRVQGGFWGGWARLTTNQYVFSLTIPGTTYDAQVRAVVDGRAGDPSEVDVTVGATNAPDAPTGLSLAIAGGTRISVSWNAVTGASSYQWRVRPPGDDFSAWVSSGTGRTASYNIGTGPNGTYAVEVRAVSSAGAGNAVSESINYVSSSSSIPGLMAVVTGTTIDVSWDAVAGATGYQIRRRAGGGDWTAWTNTTGREHSYSGLSVGTYEIEVRTTGGSPTSVTVTVAAAPAEVSGLAASVSGTTITVSWAAVSNRIRYEYRSREDGGAWSAFLSTTTTSFDHTGRKGHSFDFEVRVVTASGTSDAAEVSASIPTDLAAPSGLTLEYSGGMTIGASWDVYAGALEYQYRYREGTKPWTSWASITPPMGDHHTIISLVNISVTFGNTYTLEARAIVAAGTTQAASDSITVSPGPTTGFTATIFSTDPNTGAAFVQLTWDEVEGATGYEYRTRKGSTGTWTAWGADPIPGTGTNTSETTPELDAGFTWYFEIRATLADGTTGTSDSTSISITTSGIPMAISGLTATVRPYNRITLNWDDSASAAYFEHREVRDRSRDIFGAWTRVNVSMVAFSDLIAATQYEWEVREQTSLGGIGPVASITATTGRSPQAPGAVSGVSISITRPDGGGTFDREASVTWRTLSTLTYANFGGYEIRYQIHHLDDPMRNRPIDEAFWNTVFVEEDGSVEMPYFIVFERTSDSAGSRIILQIRGVNAAGTGPTSSITRSVS